MIRSDRDSRMAVLSDWSSSWPVRLSSNGVSIMRAFRCAGWQPNARLRELLRSLDVDAVEVVG